MYRIEYLGIVIKEHIPSLPPREKELIRRAIEDRLVSNTIEYGKPLRYSLKNHRRIRVGDYRVVYRINVESKIVTIVAIMHRKDIYE